MTFPGRPPRRLSFADDAAMQERRASISSVSGPNAPKEEIRKKLRRLDTLQTDELRTLVKELNGRVEDLEKNISELFDVLDEQNTVMDKQDEKIVELTQRVLLQAEELKKAKGVIGSLSIEGSSEVDSEIEDVPAARLKDILITKTVDSEIEDVPAAKIKDIPITKTVHGDFLMSDLGELPQGRDSSRSQRPLTSPNRQLLEADVLSPLKEAGGFGLPDALPRMEQLRPSKPATSARSSTTSAGGSLVTSTTLSDASWMGSTSGSGGFGVRQSTASQRGPASSGLFRLTLLTTSGARLHLEVPPDETVDGLKSWLVTTGATSSLPGGPSPEGARLLFRGLPLTRGVPLFQLGIEDGSVIRLVPAISAVSGQPLRSQASHHQGAETAPRGMLLMGGSGRNWRPGTGKLEDLQLPGTLDVVAGGARTVR